MLNTLKQQFRGVLYRFGYDIRKLRNAHYHHFDPFFDQQRLLGSTDAPTIFDVGANVGQTTSRYRSLFSSAHIYAFEPAERPFEALRETFRGIERVHLFQLAVAETAGSMPFYLNAEDVTNSLLPVADGAEQIVDPSWTRPVGRIDVETVTLDGFTGERGVGRIHILKMDIQGSELAALRGGLHLLERHAIDLVYTEILFAELYRDQSGFCELLNFLRGHGYKLYGLYDLHYGRNDHTLAWGDALFINRTIQETLDALPDAP